MKNKNSEQSFGEKGYSLLEILIVLMITSILAVMVISSFAKSKDKLKRQDFARQMKSYFDRAKFDSIKRRATDFDEMAKIIIENDSTYSLVSDTNSNGILEAAEINRISLPQNENFKIVPGSNVYPISIRFDFRGQIKATDGNNSPINPVFIICDSGCLNFPPNGENSNVIAVSPTGTVSLLKGGTSPQQATQANVANVGTNQKINQMGMVNN